MNERTPASHDEANEEHIPSIKDWLWGYDFFISYHWASGGTYAVNLAAQLREKGFEVFLDRSEYAMGDAWQQVGAVALRNTQRLILIATREAVFESKPVEREIVEFTGRNGRCIPIFFGDTFAAEEQANRGKFVVLDRLPDDTLYIEDTIENLQTGPAPAVVEKLAATHGVTRRRELRTRITSVVIVILIAFAIFAGTSWRSALVERNNAVKQERKAETARIKAESAEATALNSVNHLLDLYIVPCQLAGDIAAAAEEDMRAEGRAVGNGAGSHKEQALQAYGQLITTPRVNTPQIQNAIDALKDIDKTWASQQETCNLVVNVSYAFRAAWEADRKLADNASPESRVESELILKVFNEKIFKRVLEASRTVAEADEAGKDSREARRELWKLYYGDLVLIESGDVETAMIELRPMLQVWETGPPPQAVKDQVAKLTRAVDQQMAGK